MLVSESWLRQWVKPLPDSAELAEKLTLAGLEVDSVATAGPVLDDKRVVVGEILEVAKHPDADRLQVCQVSIGGAKALNIVCGAPNARVGLKTAVAINRARLPEMLVENREIRGIKSQGMLCSGAELGLDESAEGIVEFDAEAPLGVGVSEYLDLQDVVLQLELTPNRGDCLGIMGIAREISALTKGKLQAKTHAKNSSKVKASTKVSLPVQLDAPAGCPRYVGRAVMGIDMNAKTPDWMAEKLRRSGLRSINPIVDITNYVMYEIGQPMHAFDLDTLAGGIRVRWAKKGEELKLLDGSSVTLSNQNLVIADHTKAIALAGIMGGDSTAISNSTVNIYFEAAFFSQAQIQGKARELGMHTDASHRFERGVDSQGQLAAMEYATQLVMEIAGGEPGPISHEFDDAYLHKQSWINFKQSEITRVLGITIPSTVVTRILQDLGMEVNNQPSGQSSDQPNDQPNGWKVKPPSWRFDISAEHDLVEEVGRCFGFENIAPRMPTSIQRPGRHLEQKLDPYQIKLRLVSRGYHEAITYSFVEPQTQSRMLERDDAVRLANPIAENMSAMRQSLMPGLLDALSTNLNRQETRVRLFEIGHVFEAAQNSRHSVETNRLGGLICGSRMPRQWGDSVVEADFFDIKSDIEAVLQLTGAAEKFSFVKAQHPSLHPGQCAQILCKKQAIGYIGKLNPAHQKRMDIEVSVFLFEIDVDFLADRSLPCFTEVSRFPSVQRDLAVVVNEAVEVSSVLDLIQSRAGNLLVNLEIFDIFRGENIEKNKKSLAFGLTFQSRSSNLTTLEIDLLMDNIIEFLSGSLGAKLRN